MYFFFLKQEHLNFYSFGFLNFSSTIFSLVPLRLNGRRESERDGDVLVT